MDEQTEVWRSQKELGRNTVRGVKEALRFYHNYIEGKKREEQLKNREEDEKARKEFQEEFKKPGEKSYDFMLESGRSIDYHALDENIDISKLKDYLNNEKLQYCIRTSSLDGSKEIVYFTKDTPRVKAAISKSLEEILKKETKEQQRDFTKETKRLGFSPTDDVDPDTFYRDTTIYQGTTEHRLEMDGFDNIPREKVDLGISLDTEVSLIKLKEFLNEYDIKVTFSEKNGTTQMAVWLRKDKLEQQKASIKEAFFELNKNPDRVKQNLPRLKERFDKAKDQHQKMVKEKAKEKAKNKGKEVGQEISKGIKR
ncbi:MULTISPECIES: hypothetical protein [Lactococcus]|uniref:Uncharacterized protein n=1 Tax=Lactococcus formosensis TaxID=1281486 RepID=A0A9X4SH15_9LACT|nr:MULTISPECIES: hypothetical protein [Lactococcus]PST74041.1 hypothetical protein AEH57_01765 [Lactococcus garvieae]MDG6112233.1 hypothetical protein [Lactococcus formosensis]MDG6114490.1 hypothetical protein [Lactococcus formosensis]MDG6116635.1 hypothetical protein [Lactococcus formosensis]MDG6118420.1 hypothetical protein [Lactococcus formosensis]